MKTNIRPELGLHNDFFSLYLARNLTYDIKIFVNYSKYTSKPFDVEKIRIEFSSQIMSMSL